MRGKILSSKGNVYVVLGEDGIFYNVFPRGLLKFRNKNVMVGDECNIDDENFSIEDILPRKNSLIRPKVSNVDQIFVMMSVKRPELSKELIFKFLTYVNMNNVEPKLILTKYDLLDDKSMYNDFIDELNKLGVEVFLISKYDESSISLLKEKLKNYEFLQRNNTEIRKENERLREQLQFATHIEQKNFPAQIIGRNPDNIYSGITINKGSRSGIKKGMSVIAVQNGTTGLVGKIVTVGLETSLVMPVYDSKCVVSSRIQNTRDIGLVSGSGNANSPLQMKYIKKRVLSELNFGDIVVTSGETDNYVADIPVGTITNIMVVEYDSSLNIEITPVVDFARLETVIVTDLKEPNPLLEGSRR